MNSLQPMVDHPNFIYILKIFAEESPKSFVKLSQCMQAVAATLASETLKSKSLVLREHDDS